MEKNMMLTIDTSLDTSGAEAGLAAFATAVQGIVSKITLIISQVAGKVKGLGKLFDFGGIIGTLGGVITTALKVILNSDIAKDFEGLAQQFGDKIITLKALIGEAVMPVVGIMMELGNKLLDFFISIANSIRIASGQFFAGAGESAVAADRAVTSQKSLAKATTAAGKAAKGALASFDELNILQSQSTGSSGSVQKPQKPPTTAQSPELTWLERLKKALEPLTKAVFEGLAWGYENVIRPIGDWVTDAALPSFLEALASAATLLVGVLELLQPVGEWLWNSFLAPLGEWTGDMIIDGLSRLNELFGVLSRWLGDNTQTLQGMVGWLSPLFDGVAESFAAMLEGLRSTFGLWLDAFASSMTAMLDLVTGIFTGNWELAWQSVQELFAASGTLLLEQLYLLYEGITIGAGLLLTTLTELLTPFGEWVMASVITPIGEKFGWLWDFIATGMDIAVNVLKGIFGPFVTWLYNNVIKSIYDMIVKLVADMIEHFKLGLGVIGEGFVKSVADAIEHFAIGVNFFIGLINKLIDGLNSIQVSIPPWVPKYGGKQFGINIPYIPTVAVPKLATGAVIPANREFLAILGDQKSGRNLEAPESLIRQIVREESGSGQDSTPISVELTLDGDVIYRAMLDRESRQGARVGGVFANAY